jgi:hypothetical protein
VKIKSIKVDDAELLTGEVDMAGFNPKPGIVLGQIVGGGMAYLNFFGSKNLHGELSSDYLIKQGQKLEIQF